LATLGFPGQWKRFSGIDRVPFHDRELQMSRKVILWIAVGLIVALPLLYWFGLYSAESTEAFAAAAAHVRQDRSTVERVGEVTRVSIAPFGYKIIWGAAGGEATFTLRVAGTKGESSFVVELRERDKRWQVTRLAPA